MGGDADLGTLEGGQEQAGFPLDVFSDEVVFLAFELNRLLDDGHRDFQERDRRLQEFLMMDGTVAIVGKLLQHMTDACLGTDHRVPGYAQPLGQAIRRLEANAVDIEGQTIRILPDPDNGLVPIGLVNADRTGRANAMRVQKDHNLADDFLGFPRFNHPLFAFGTNPVKLGQPFGGLLNDVKDVFLEGLDQLFGKVWSNTFDHPRAEILFHAFEGTGRDDAQGLRLELQAMRPIVDPDALALNILARGDGRCRADDRDQIPVPSDFDP